MRQLYRKKDVQQSVEDFILPFDGKFSADNRWLIKAQLISWDDIKASYSDLFLSDIGNVTELARVDFGLPVIKETLGLTDKETLEQSRGNPYLQYFLGFKEFNYEKPFDPSLMVCYRKRYSKIRLNELACWLCREQPIVLKQRAYAGSTS